MHYNAEGGLRREMVGTCLLLAPSSMGNNDATMGNTTTRIAIVIAKSHLLLLLLNQVKDL